MSKTGEWFRVRSYRVEDESDVDHLDLYEFMSELAGSSEALDFLLENALACRWEFGWSANSFEMNLAKNKLIIEGISDPSHDQIYQKARNRKAFAQVLLSQTKSMEARLRFGLGKR